MGCATSEPGTRWPGGVIPVAFDTKTVPMGHPIRATVQAAQDLWQATTPIRFVPFTGQNDSITIAIDPAVTRCNSRVGRVGGEQVIRCVGSASVSRVAHELGHAIGLFHEQQRFDRDAMVAVSQLALRDEPQNYKRQDSALLLGSYDFSSLMHYPWNDGRARGLLTKIHPEPAVRGTEPSAGDLAAVRQMYLVIAEKTPVAARCSDSDHMTLWAVDATGVMQTNSWNGGWFGWHELGGPTFPPRAWIAALGRRAEHQEIYAIDVGGAVRSNWQYDGVWKQWYSLGAPPVPNLSVGQLPLTPGAPVAAMSRFKQHMEVWVVGVDGVLYGTWWDGDRWNGWFGLPGPSFPSGAYIAAHSRNDDFMDVFVIGNDGRMYGNWWHGNWKGWYQLPVPGALLPGAPIAASGRHEDHMEVFTVDGRGQVVGAFWDGSWHAQVTGGPAPITGLPSGGGLPPGAPIAALSRAEEHIEVWCVGNDQRLHARPYWETWKSWYVADPVPFAAGSPVTVVTRDEDFMDVFLAGPAGASPTEVGVQSTWWSGSWKGLYRVV